MGDYRVIAHIEDRLTPEVKATLHEPLLILIVAERRLQPGPADEAPGAGDVGDDRERNLVLHIDILRYQAGG